MKGIARDLWLRAKDALRTAGHDLNVSPDAAASRSYYSAFFALDGRFFTRHSAVEAAVHRDLVKPGIWDDELGRGYGRLVQLRALGDYGGGRHVLPEEAQEAILIASRILSEIEEILPRDFGME